MVYFSLYLISPLLSIRTFFYLAVHSFIFIFLLMSLACDRLNTVCLSVYSVNYKFSLLVYIQNHNVLGYKKYFLWINAGYVCKKWFVAV